MMENPTSLSPKRPIFGLPEMELLTAHLPKENLSFLVFCLKRSIYFKHWIWPSCTEKFPPGPIFYFLLHSTPQSVVSLWRIFRHFHLPCKSLAFVSPSVTCFVMDPISWLRNIFSSEMSCEAASTGLPGAWGLSFPLPRRATSSQRGDQNEGRERASCTSLSELMFCRLPS